MVNRRRLKRQIRNALIVSAYTLIISCIALATFSLIKSLNIKARERARIEAQNVVITVSKQKTPAVKKTWTYINEPEQYNSLYEGVHCITDETSKQWEWLQTHDYYFNEDGIAEYNGKTLVALTPAFGSVGDEVDLLLQDGSILQVIICDVKADAETYGHKHGDLLNVIEIMVNEKWYDEMYDNKYYPDVVAFR